MAQPPYSHVENSTRAEVDHLGLTALRAMVDVEPYGSSDLGVDPSDDEPPSLTSASPSEDDDPEDPENPSGKKKKKMRKTTRHERRRSKEAKAIAISKIVANLPEFMGKDLSEFAESFGRFLGFTRIGEEERRDGEAIALHKTHIWPGQAKPTLVVGWSVICSCSLAPGEGGQADCDKVRYLRRRVGCLKETVPLF